jgi:hypothetical protein
MPCYLVVTIELKETEIAKMALDELGLVEGKHYRMFGSTIQLNDSSLQGQLKQRYGVLKAEREARRKGYRTQRQTQNNGDVVVTLLRN